MGSGIGHEVSGESQLAMEWIGANEKTGIGASSLSSSGSTFDSDSWATNTTMTEPLTSDSSCLAALVIFCASYTGDATIVDVWG